MVELVSTATSCSATSTERFVPTTDGQRCIRAFCMIRVSTDGDYPRSSGCWCPEAEHGPPQATLSGRAPSFLSAALNSRGLVLACDDHMTDVLKLQTFPVETVAVAHEYVFDKRLASFLVPFEHD